MEDLIINFCPTGMIPTKSMTPYVPISVEEIVEQTHEAYEMGITIVHLHARDEITEIPTYKKQIYRDIFEGIRKHCPDLIICGSTSGRNFPEFEKRSEVIELMPDMCSLTLSSLNFINQSSLNDPSMIVRLAEKMYENGVNVEMECFDLGMINYGKYLISKQIIRGPFYWNLLFGNIAGFQGNYSHIGQAISEIPNNHFVGIAGLGSSQLSVVASSIALGYGVRIGIEDNIWFDVNKTKKCKNIDLVRRVHELMSIHERKLFCPKRFGELGFYNKNR